MAAMHRYIVIEGPLGVGKSSLTRMLAERLGAQTLLEDVEENPFLVKFYQNPKKHGFQAQIFFLLRRYNLALEMSQMGLFQRTTVSDFLFDKDQVFARVNLEDHEFWLYEQLYQILKKRVSSPDLVIFLQAKTEVLMQRLKNRNKKYEKSITFKYLDKVNQAFNEFFFHYSECPLLVVNASEIDFVHVPEDFEDLVERIGSMKSGVQYYIPMSSKKD
jgi:deoxyguanosine kinase